jgi:hypothetical protein
MWRFPRFQISDEKTCAGSEVSPVSSVGCERCSIKQVTDFEFAFRTYQGNLISCSHDGKKLSSYMVAFGISTPVAIGPPPRAPA